MLEKIEHGAVREIRLARPPVNALDPGLVVALEQALAEAATDARGIVLSGQPGMFSAGLDMKALMALDRDAMAAFWMDFHALLKRLATSSVPIVAALTGHSPAGGAVMAIFCDARVAAAGEFKIGLNEVQVGMTLPPIIHTGLVRLVGPRQAERLGVGGLLLGPDEAAAIGLVDEVVPIDQVVARAVERCTAYTRLPPKAMTETRVLCRADLAAAFERVADRFSETMNAGWFGEETQVTMRAVLAQLAAKKS